MTLTRGDLNTSELSFGRALISALPLLCLMDTWEWVLIQVATQVGFANIRETIRKGMGMSHEGSGWDRSFFCVLRNLPDFIRREMLQTEFSREIGCSGSFACVRGGPQHCCGVFSDDFGK